MANRVSYGLILNNVIALMVPLALTAGTFAATWWYVVIYNAPTAQTVAAPSHNGYTGAEPGTASGASAC